MCAKFTYTALSKWHKYLILTRTNALMTDFLTLQVVIQATKHKSDECARQLYTEVFVWLQRIFNFIPAIEF